MTIAPASLRSARSLLLEHLGPHGLSPLAVGIVGDPAHIGGYHCGSDRVRRSAGQIADYSVVESSRDRTGLTDAASALDIGTFRAFGALGRTYDLRHLSSWIVGQCQAGAADTRDIREVIWSPDGTSVRRWDRLGRRSTGDSSHRTHTHISYFRDAVKAGRDQTPLFRRYLTDIGLIKQASKEEDMVAWSDSWGDGSGGRETAADRLAMAAHSARDALAEVRALRTAVTALAEARPGADTTAILARMDALAAEDRERDQAAARERAELAELVRAGQAGQLAADEVVRLIGERLNAGTVAQG